MTMRDEFSMVDNRHPIPNIAGKVLTVNGPIESQELGVTATHEHLFIDIRKTHYPHEKRINIPGKSEPFITSDEFPATELAVWEAKLGPGNLQMAIDGEPISDNYVLADETMAIREVERFRRLGGNSIVDVTCIGQKRDPAALKRVSDATGLNIVMGTSHYQKAYHPEDMDQRTVEDLTAEYVRDVVEGVYDTGIRSGVIGEVGVNGSPLSDNEIKVIRASARASVITGAPISFHRGGNVDERHTVLDIVVEEEMSLSRVILGHQDELSLRLPLVRELLERGVWVQFDLIGRQALQPPFPDNPYHSDRSLTEDIRDAVVRLVQDGYEDRLLLSQDVCRKAHLTCFGGFGYAFILERFLPELREYGLTEDQNDKLMRLNPASALQFTEPYAP